MDPKCYKFSLLIEQLSLVQQGLRTKQTNTFIV
jgi:hypothetical protein